MANSLLDFVMSVVRDPGAAAAYAANPAQAIADANLTDVTSVDVNNLIPVVAESMSSMTPSAGADVLGESAGNVWASGAATEAFDAFDDQLPQQVIDDPQGVISDVISTSDPSVINAALPANVPTIASLDDTALLLDATGIDDAIVDAVPDAGWVQQVDQAQADDHPTPDDAGFGDVM